MNLDTVDRLETFLTYAQQHAREVKDNRKPTQSAEEGAVARRHGWLHGNAAAEADPKLAINLWHARDLAMYFLKTDDEPAREQAVSSFVKQVEMPLDHYARMIKMLPPAQPADVKKLGTEQNELQWKSRTAKKGSYLVQLPPDYLQPRVSDVIPTAWPREGEPYDAALAGRGVEKRMDHEIRSEVGTGIQFTMGIPPAKINSRSTCSATFAASSTWIPIAYTSSVGTRAGP
ncbi:MAG: hypothetical protein U0744_17260 [Gemmataceae bacterium]